MWCFFHCCCCVLVLSSCFLPVFPAAANPLGLSESPPKHSPELAPGTHVVLGPHLHAVEGWVGISVSGQVAAHHLVLVVLEVALRSSISKSGEPTAPKSATAKGAVSITMAREFCLCCMAGLPDDDIC